MSISNVLCLIFSVTVQCFFKNDASLQNFNEKNACLDELIIECCQEDAETVIDVLYSTLTNAVKLKARLDPLCTVEGRCCSIMHTLFTVFDTTQM